MIRCDHCRRGLGSKIHRYWQMRFCSMACADAYSRRLSEETRAKIQQLDLAREELPAGFFLRSGHLIQHLLNSFAR
jgi:hypothetical protein